MTSASQIAWDDMILPFQLDRADIRGRVARLDGVLQTILDQHAYPLPVSALVAEAGLLTALIGQTMKLRWRLSLQIRAEGAIRLIATDYFAPDADGGPARLRAYAGFDPEAVAAAGDTPAFDLLGKGVFGMTIDQGPGSRPYQGITPLAGGSLAACAEAYFAQSEQIATRFELSAACSSQPGKPEAWRSGGVMLQHMPKASPHVSEATGEDGLLAPADVVSGNDGENWERANLLLDTVETHEMVGPHVSPDRLLLRLFHEESPRVYDAQPVRFGCTCSEEKVVNAMAQYSAKDLTHMTNSEGMLTADCQFCGAHYAFDPKTLGFEAEN